MKSLVGICGIEQEPMRSLKLALKRAKLIQMTTEGSGVTEMFLINDIETAINAIENPEKNFQQKGDS